MSEDTTAVSPEPLATTLLGAAPTPSGRRPQSPWGYRLTGIVFASVLVIYHLSVLLIWNIPGKGLSKEFHKTYLSAVKGYEYFRGTRNNQSWAMFAPNPTRTNAFIRVLVTDGSGHVWDYDQDIWELNRYPYIWYDRGGKVNRRIDNKKTYQRMYAAWVCREWERHHDGESAKSVQFIKRWTHVPHSDDVVKNGGWDQWSAPYKQKEQETVTCATVPNGQLSDGLRARYGLESAEEEVFKPVKSRSWWHKLEAERKREAKQAERDAARERREAVRATKLQGRSSMIPDARGPVREEPEREEPSTGDDDESPDQ